MGLNLSILLSQQSVFWIIGEEKDEDADKSLTILYGDQKKLAMEMGSMDFLNNSHGWWENEYILLKPQKLTLK